jgi:hypothetical protein
MPEIGHLVEEGVVAAGALRAALDDVVLLWLPAEVRPVFEERLHASHPERAAKVLNALRDMRGGALYRAEFGARMHGEGARWGAVHQLFRVHCRRLGLEHERDAEPAGPVAPGPSGPSGPRPGQLELFE